MAILASSQLTCVDVTDGEISFAIYSQGLDGNNNITLKAVVTESGKEVTNGQYRWYRYVATTEIINDDTIETHDISDLDNASDSSFQVCKHIIENEEQDVIQSTITTEFKENEIYKCEFSYSLLEFIEGTGTVDEELWKKSVAYTAYFNVNTRRMLYTSLPHDGLYVAGDLWFVGESDFKITGDKGDSPIFDSNNTAYVLTTDDKPVADKVYYTYDSNMGVISVAEISDGMFGPDVSYYELMDKEQSVYKYTMLVAIASGNGTYKSSDWSEAFDFNIKIEDTNKTLTETNSQIGKQQGDIEKIYGELEKVSHHIQFSDDGGMKFTSGTYDEKNGIKEWTEGPFSANFNSQEISFSFNGNKTAWLSGETTPDTHPQFCVSDAAIVNTLDAGGSVSGTGTISVYSSVDSGALVIQSEANGSFSLVIDNSPRSRQIPSIEVKN